MTCLVRLSSALTALALTLALGGCSFIGSLTGGSAPDVSSSVPGTGELPGDEPVDHETEQDVRWLVGLLDEFEGFIEAGGHPRLAAVDQDLARRLFLEPAENIRSYHEFEAFQERYLDLKLALAKRAGPRAVEIMGDGRPVTEVDPDAVEALQDALRACGELSRIANSEKQVPIYEKKLARARTIDEATLRAPGFAVRIASCELVLAGRSLDFADDYVAEQGTHEVERGCGQVEFAVRAVKTGRGWGSWEYAMGSTSYADRVSCGKLAKRTKKLPKGAGPAIEEALGRIDAQGAVTWNGRYTTQVDEDDLHVYRYATLTLHSKNLAFSKNACGGKGDDLVCEASGSKSVAYYNRLGHWRKRAAAHRKAGRADRCKALLKKAVAEYESFQSMHESLTRSGGWAKGLRYKPRTAKKPLSEKAFLAAMRRAGEKADQQLLGGWCSK